MDNEKVTLTMRVRRELVDIEIEQCTDGTITVHDNVCGRGVMDLRVSDLERFLDLIRAGGANGND